MNKRLFFSIMLFICSHQSAVGSDVIKTYAQRLLARPINDTTIEHEFAYYSTEGLQELRQIIMHEKAKAQNKLANKNKIRAVAGIFSIVPGSMIGCGAGFLYKAWGKFLHGTSSFTIAENIFGIPGEAALSKNEAEVLGIFGVLLTAWGAYLLSYTLPTLCSSFDHEEEIIKKAEVIIASFEKELTLRHTLYLNC